MPGADSGRSADGQATRNIAVHGFHGQDSFSGKSWFRRSRVKKPLATATVAAPCRETGRSGWKLRFSTPLSAAASRQSRVEKPLVPQKDVAARVSRCWWNRRRLSRQRSKKIEDRQAHAWEFCWNFSQKVVCHVCLFLCADDFPEYDVLYFL